MPPKTSFLSNGSWISRRIGNTPILLLATFCKGLHLNPVLYSIAILLLPVPRYLSGRSWSSSNQGRMGQPTKLWLFCGASGPCLRFHNFMWYPRHPFWLVLLNGFTEARARRPPNHLFRHQMTQSAFTARCYTFLNLATDTVSATFQALWVNLLNYTWCSNIPLKC